MSIGGGGVIGLARGIICFTQVYMQRKGNVLFKLSLVKKK